jgi:hypothetical protein
MTRKNPLSLDLQQDTTPVPRRRFTQLVVAGAVGMALTACGGGSDSDGGGSEPLRAVFDKLTPGLNKAKVLAMVDFAPINNTEATVTWTQGSEQLSVSFNLLEPYVESTATVALWTGSGGRKDQRSLTGV